MPPVWSSQIEDHEIYHAKGLNVRLELRLEYHTGNCKILLGSTPILRDNTLREGQGPPTSHLLPPTSRGVMWLDGCLEYHHDAKTLYIYKYSCLLRDSNLGPTVQ
ncbi:uncharacterized protein TNCV_931201 [Trichonephila clavipes]|uniref:Uncharacterized protein n=1 Tax=Trichonephila clavipes TaxID=2585209 RepID=A0A8X6W2L5_TRICX|nr:uncharacterized protein TNCV_931201 [Trichonephila clavipes]